MLFYLLSFFRDATSVTFKQSILLFSLFLALSNIISELAFKFLQDLNSGFCWIIFNLAKQKTPDCFERSRSSNPHFSPQTAILHLGKLNPSFLGNRKRWNLNCLLTQQQSLKKFALWQKIRSKMTFPTRTQITFPNIFDLCNFTKATFTWGDDLLSLALGGASVCTPILSDLCGLSLSAGRHQDIWNKDTLTMTYQ